MAMPEHHILLSRLVGGTPESTIEARTAILWQFSIGSLTMNTVQHYRWQDLPEEQLKPGLSRKLITSERMMIAHVYLKKGEEVPRHSHENEQLTYILEGALHFWFGAEGEREITVRAGEVVVIPSNVPHRAVALEDTLDVDVFCPPRQDWLSGTDAYLRG